MHAVIQTPAFTTAAHEAGISADEVDAVVQTVSDDPMAGDVMAGTGGARKLRVAGRGKGKSGGYRVITFYAAEDVPVFLLDAYSKGDAANLTKAERNELRDILGQIADTYRAGVQAKIVDMKRRVQGHGQQSVEHPAGRPRGADDRQGRGGPIDL